MVYIVGNVEDDKCLSTLTFMKSKLQNINPPTIFCAHVCTTIQYFANFPICRLY